MNKRLVISSITMIIVLMYIMSIPSDKKLESYAMEPTCGIGTEEINGICEISTTLIENDIVQKRHVIFPENDYFVEFMPSNLNDFGLNNKDLFKIEALIDGCERNHLMSGSSHAYERICKQKIVNKINGFSD